jgi:hypothetical protein
VNNVYAFFDPDSPHPLTRLWIKSWAARGWAPKLILPSETEAGLTLRQVANRRGGGPVVTMDRINFSWRPRARKQPSSTLFPSTRGDVIVFPKGATEDDVLHCGRELKCQ